MLSAHVQPVDVATGAEVVEQVTHAGATVRLLKETVKVPLERGGLVLVRKRPVAGAPRRGALLFLHGYAQNRYAWHISRRSLTAYLAADGFDVFNLDFRGAGRSRLLGTPLPTSFEEYVEGDMPRAIAEIRAVTGESRVFLVGHSLGGAVACAYAGLAPERVRGVVTIAGLYEFARENRFLRVLAHAADAVVRSGLAPYIVPDPLPTDLVGRALHLSRIAWDSRVGSWMPLQAWAPGSIEPEVLREAVHRSFEPATLDLTLRLAAMARGSTFGDRSGRCYHAPFERLSFLPLLVVVGEADALISPADARAGFERSRSRDKRFLPFAREDGVGWGHIDLVLGARAPGRVWPELRAWLRAR